MDCSKSFDADAFGQILKNARKSRELTRNSVAEELNIAPRYLMSIENNGKIPSLQVFYNLVILFGISVDNLFYNEREKDKSAKRRQLDALMGQMQEEDLVIVESTVQGILKARKIRNP